MHRSSRLLSTTLLLLAAMALQGCVGFSGPNAIRNSIAKSQDIKLKKEFGVDVGPLGVLLADVVAGQYIPVDLDGISWVSYGEYVINPTANCTLDEFCLDEVELKGWEPFVRIREPGSNLRLMHNASGDRIKKMLFLQQEQDHLMIVSASGNFDKIIDNLFESDLMGDIDFFREIEESGEYVPDEAVTIEVARNTSGWYF